MSTPFDLGYQNPVATVQINTGFVGAAQAQAAAISTAADRAATAADRVQTGLDRTQTDADAASTAADRAQTGLDRTQTGLDRAATGSNASSTAADRTAVAADRAQADADAAATAADRVQTGLDRTTTTNNAAATAADRTQTGLDRTQTGADRVQTGLDRVQTGADRIQTGQDVVTSNTNAALAASNSLTATAQASLAATYASSASSVVQQDLSAVALQALHRSPNAIVAQCIYNVDKDSDPGWPDRVTNTSWFNEALNGTWLVPTDPRGWQSELDARSSGATLGAEMVTNGTFANGTTGWTSPYGSVLTVPRANTLRATTGAGQTVNYATQNFSVTAGNTYVATATPVAKVTAAGAACDFRVGTSSQGSEYGRNSSIPPGQTARIVFTATATGTIYVGLVADNGGVAGDYAEWQNISVKPITALNTASGAYYQLATDGKFYRLWKNILPNSAWAGGTSGTEGSGAVAPSGWFFSTGSGVVTFVSSTYNPTGSAIRFQATAQRPYVASNPYSVSAGATYALSAKVEAVTSGTPSIQDLLGYAGGTASSTVWKANGVTVTNAYVVQAGDLLELDLVFTGAASTAFRVGAGAATNVTCDVTMSAPQVEIISSGNATAFENKTTTDQGTTEVFRGNTAKFPRLSAIIAEAANVTIYDLTQPGRPMWMRFTTAATQLLNANITSVAMLNGSLRVGSSVSGLAIFEFISDNKWGVRADTNKYRVGSMANRNAATDPNFVGYFSANTLVNTVVNAVAMTVLPDAPLDPFTGLQVPTIAVATAGGVSVIKHDGSVVNSSQTASTLDCHIQGYMLYLSNQLTITGYARYQDLRTIAANWTPTSFPAYIINTPAVASEVVSMPLANGVIAHRQNAGGLYGVDLTQLNPANPASSLKAYLAPYYNTGWMTGDIRRCWLSSNVAESITATELVNAGNMSNPAAWTFGTIGTVTSASVSGGVMSLPRTDAANYSYAWQIVPTVIGKVYTLNVTAGATSILGKVSATTFNSAGIGAPVFAANTTTPYTFVATSATTYITLLSNIDATTATVTLVSVTEVIADRSYKNKPLTIFGTLAKVLSGGLAMYGPFSPTNYAQEAYSSDLDFGTGAWSVGAWANVPTTGFGPANFVANNTMQGAVAGTPGTLPTGGWSINSFPAGITTQVVGTGVEGGINYIDFRVSGTPTATAIGFLPFVASTAILAANGQTWVGSCFLKVAAGSLAGLTLFQYTGGRDSTGAGIPGQNSATPVSPTAVDALNLQRFTVSNTFSSGSVTRVQPYIGFSFTSGTAVDCTLRVGMPQLEQGSAHSVIPTSGVIYNGIAPVFERSAATGAYIKHGIDGNGAWACEVYDTVTTRRVTSPAAYNNATNVKVRAEYATSGTLTLKVNGQPVATATGTPLLTLNNASAVTTIGNARTLDAAFPGSIALVKASATTPTQEQSTFMYEQEKFLFAPNAICTLPDSGAVVDIAYDDMQDRLKVVSAANESAWTGLVCTSTSPVSAGSFTKASHRSGVKLLARSTTNPGVDVTIPAYGLREELFNRAERASKLARLEQVFDYVGGFTATTTLNSTALTSVTNLTYPSTVNLRGIPISGTGIPAGTVITDISGTTIYISAPATASGSGVAINLTQFPLPVGYEVIQVLNGGTVQREGSTSAFTRQYDGFRESEVFAVAPGNTAWVQLKARRTAQ
jgi:hypothetical protein